MTFNESVQVFELPTPPPVTSNDEEAKQKPALPYTKTRMKVKKDTIKFEEIVSTDKAFYEKKSCFLRKKNSFNRRKSEVVKTYDTIASK